MHMKVSSVVLFPFANSAWLVNRYTSLRLFSIGNLTLLYLSMLVFELRFNADACIGRGLLELASKNSRSLFEATHNEKRIFVAAAASALQKEGSRRRRDSSSPLLFFHKVQLQNTFALETLNTPLRSFTLRCNEVNGRTKNYAQKIPLPPKRKNAAFMYFAPFAETAFCTAQQQRNSIRRSHIRSNFIRKM